MGIKQLPRIIFLTLSVFCMATIFGFSAQDGPETSSVSTEVTEAIVSVVNAGKMRVNPNHNSLQFQNLHHFVRKMAHFSIYCTLAFCVCGFFNTFAWRRVQIVLSSLSFCFLYACVDEFHQSFIAGRGPAFTDVLIDTSGAAIGIAVLLLAVYLLAKITKNNHTVSE
ncbi:MAG: VanZ family protein [Ruthenibacterium sp.]